MTTDKLSGCKPLFNADLAENVRRAIMTTKQRLTRLQNKLTPDNGQQVIIHWQTGNHPGDYYNTTSKQWLTQNEYQALQGDLLTVIVRYADN